MPKQLTLHQRTHHGGAIDGHKRPGGAYIMDTAGGDLLSRSGLAQEQRGPTALPEFLHQSQNLPRTNGLTYQ